MRLWDRTSNSKILKIQFSKIRCFEPLKGYKTQLELLKEDKHNMEIKIGELEVDNNRFKVEIDELRVARNQVKCEPIATQLRHKMSHRGSVMLFLDIYLWF